MKLASFWAVHLTSMMIPILAVALAQTADAEMGSISGTVTYRERIALPETAELALTISRSSRGVVQPVTSLTMLLGRKQVPIHFVMPYQLSSIEKGQDYILRAEIRDRGEVLFRTSEGVAVITNGRNRTELTLVRNGNPGQTQTQVNYADQKWELIELNGRSVRNNQGRPHVTFRSQGNELLGHGGVNQFGGSWKVTGETLQVDVGAMTMIGADEERLRLETDFISMLGRANRAEVNKDQLQLSRGNQILAKFRRGR